MWGTITGVIVVIYIAIFSILRASSKGEEVSRRHRAELLAAKEKNLSDEKVEETESKENNKLKD